MQDKLIVEAEKIHNLTDNEINQEILELGLV